MNYNYAKFHAFIKKLTIDVIFPLVITYFMCCKLTLPHFLAVEHCSPQCIKTPLIQIMSYIYTHLWYMRLVDTRGGTMFYKIIPFLVD